MFLLEILELKKRSSDKKAIINYISVLDLLLVENDRQISSQIQWKITKLLPNKSYEKIELSKIYNYRSKIIHGDYKKSIKILEELKEETGDNFKEYQKKAIKYVKNLRRKANKLGFDTDFESFCNCLEKYINIL